MGEGRDGLHYRRHEKSIGSLNEMATQAVFKPSKIFKTLKPTQTCLHGVAAQAEEVSGHAGRLVQLQHLCP